MPLASEQLSVVSTNVWTFHLSTNGCPLREQVRSGSLLSVQLFKGHYISVQFSPFGAGWPMTVSRTISSNSPR